MGKEYVNQHFVSQRYLNRFGTPNTNNDGYNIGVLRKKKDGSLHHFRQAVGNIAYKKNFYDISYLDNPKYWEKYFSNEIEPLYGDYLNRVISKIMLSSVEKYKLSVEERRQLSKLLIFQYARVPAFIKPALEKESRICNQAKKEILNKYDTLLNDEQRKLIWDYKPETDFVKNVTIETFSSEENLNYFASIIEKGVFLIIYNDTDIPFFTSDNPVVLYNYMEESLNYGENGLVNSNTIIYYPLSPKIMLQVVPKGFKLWGLEVVDGSLNVLKPTVRDINYIAKVNDFQIEHATSEIYITIDMLELFNENTVEG